MDAAWIDAAIPNPVIVLRMRLRPYSIGHELLLRRLESPFISGGGVGIADLIHAVLICSLDYRHGLKALECGTGTRLFMRLWRVTIWTLNAPAEIQAFEDYREDGLWCPDLKIPTVGRDINSPRLFRLMGSLMADFGFTEEAALNCPIAKANAYFCARGDENGTVDLFSPRDQALFDKLREMPDDAPELATNGGAQ